MSATTEILTEKITQLKEKISIERRAGRDTTLLERQCSEFLSQLNQASTALNENKQLLKG